MFRNMSRLESKLVGVNGQCTHLLAGETVHDGLTFGWDKISSRVPDIVNPLSGTTIEVDNRQDELFSIFLGSPPFLVG